MMDPRRHAMHAAVAAGGVSAVLMSTAVHKEKEAEISAAANECVDPLLRATVFAIEAAAGLPGEDQRAALRDVLVDFLELPAIGQPGRCRICGCADEMACTESADGEWDGPCAWADESHTLCDNPDCVKAATAEATSNEVNQGRTAS